MPRPARRLNQQSLLTSLSSEVINRVLSNLDWRTIIKCRLVCKFLRSAVDQCPAAQYAIELAVSSMEDGTQSHFTTASKLALLKEHNTCWDALKWGETRDIPLLQKDIIWNLCGGVFAQSGLPGALRLHQLPSQYRNVQATSWRIPLLNNTYDFTMDPAQDLLALVETPVLIATHNNTKSHVRIRIHLRSIATGQVHPLVINSVRIIDHILDMQCAWVDLSLQVSGDLIGVLFIAQFETPELTAWNWKTGELILTRSSCDIATFTFLTSHLLLVGTVMNESEVIQPQLFILDLSIPSKIKVTLTADYTCIFGLPSFSLVVKPIKIVIRSDPSPEWKPNPRTQIPFSVARGQRLFLITICVEEKKKEVSYDLFAPADILLSYVTALPPQTRQHIIDWDTWGPTGTRLLKSPPHSIVWTGYVFGSKFVLVTPPKNTAGQPLQTLQIWNFNQLVIKRATALGLENENMHYVNDTTVVKDKVFAKTIRTSLPYSVTTRTLPPRSPEFTDAMCSEDAILLATSDRCYLRVLIF